MTGGRCFSITISLTLSALSRKPSRPWTEPTRLTWILPVRDYGRDQNYSWIMQKYLQFIFFKFYGYFRKRWPEHDPPDYAQGAIATYLSIDLAVILILLLEVARRHDLMEGSSKYIIVLIPAIIVFPLIYWYFLHDDKYREYIKDEHYKNDKYQGWKGTMLIVLFFLIPALLCFMYALYVID